MDNMEQVRQLLAQIAALLGGDPTSPPAVQYPAMVLHRGVTYRLEAPLAADYEPSMLARIMGSQPGTFVADPSNAPQGYARRSPAGYPLFYAISGDGSVVGQPRVLHGDQSFAEESELIGYAEALRQREANINAHPTAHAGPERDALQAAAEASWAAQQAERAKRPKP